MTTEQARTHLARLASGKTFSIGLNTINYPSGREQARCQVYIEGGSYFERPTFEEALDAISLELAWSLPRKYRIHRIFHPDAKRDVWEVQRLTMPSGPYAAPGNRIAYWKMMTDEPFAREDAAVAFLANEQLDEFIKENEH